MSIIAEILKRHGFYGTRLYYRDENQTYSQLVGQVKPNGLENDTYKLTEVHTDSGYLLLREDVTIEIAADSTAKVNGTAVTMTGTGALVPLTVVGNKGFELPKTGGYGTWMFTAGGVLLLSAAALTMVKAKNRK